MHMAGTDLGHSGISFKNYQNYSASFLSLSKVINFDFIVEWIMHVYLKDFQDIAVPLRVKMYQLVDFDFSKSAIQFASLFPSSTGILFISQDIFFGIK